MLMRGFTRTAHTTGTRAGFSLAAFVCASLVGGAAVGCASTGATNATAAVVAPAGGPRDAAQAVIEGFRGQDWEKVSSGLSEARRAQLDDSWYSLWVGEVKMAQDLQVTDAAIDPDGVHARVRVAFRIDGKARETTVRMLNEAGSWKWDER